MALANIAILLARRGLRVLMVDWDLEAPGLHQYFLESKVEASNRGGLLELLADIRSADKIKSIWREYSSTVTVERNTILTLLTAGRFDSEYEKRVLEFDWHEFFLKRNGGEALEALRSLWIEQFDVTLIDSRTGITDSGGVCTVQMPDILVLIFSANRQSLDGTKQVARRAQIARQALAYDRTRLLIFPLPSRFDSRTEFRESQHWLKTFANELEEFYCDWLPKDVMVPKVLERTKLPYVAYFSFGEKLPVVTEGTTDPESLGFAYQNAATLIATDFKNPAQILTSSSRPLIGDSDDKQSFDVVEVEKRLADALLAMLFLRKPSYALLAAPSHKIDLPKLIESHDNDLVRLIEQPPRIRDSGFDLRTGGRAELFSRGKARRASSSSKLLELWRDGYLIFVANGEEFLCRDVLSAQRVHPFPLMINSLILAESALLFCELGKQVYSEAIPHPRTIQYGLRINNLIHDSMHPILVPEEVGVEWPEERSYKAEEGAGSFSVTVDFEEEPAVAAWRLVAELYVWFGIEHDKIPYTIRGDGPPKIDKKKIASLRRQ